VDGNGASAAVVSCRLVPIAGLPLPVALPVALSFSLSFSLSFLVSTGHLLALLQCSVSVVHFALSIVCWRATTV
jgi:hypothetical protein